MVLVSVGTNTTTSSSLSSAGVAADWPDNTTQTQVRGRRQTNAHETR